MFTFLCENHQLKKVILISENFLHYLWRFQFFEKLNLETTDGKPLHIFNSGEINFNSGPDFTNAKIKIGNQLWAGNVELHINASDWYRHEHESDLNYNNVILHVIWNHDSEIFLKNNLKIPAFLIKNYVPEKMLNQYFKLFDKKKKWINCENFIVKTDNFLMNNWLENLYFERLKEKSNFIKRLLIDSKYDWEYVFFLLLTKNFGLKINGESFFNLAKSIDYKIIRKEQHDISSLEALFFGQAGFFNKNIEDKYFQELKSKYLYLQVKYNIEPIFNGQFYFFRLRPNNFPTIRISQLAGLLNKQKNLFSRLMAIKKIEKIHEYFDVKTSDFWVSHFNFTSRKGTISSKNKLTKSFIDLIIINTIIPLKFYYYTSLGTNDGESILELAKQLKPEDNQIIKKFRALGVKSKNSFDSQALLQLKSHYCNKNRCLNCSIGNAYLKN